LINIFEFLHSSDRFQASQCCRRFQEASEHRDFIEDSQLTFNKITFSDNAAPAKDFLESFRIFPNLSFNEVEFSDCLKFWQLHGENVESLTINSCDITVRQLMALLIETKNLKTLKIQNSRELFMSGRLFESNELDLRHVTSLSLSQNQYLSDILFSRITSKMPHLSSLDLSSNSISFHRGLYKKFYPKSNDDDEVGSESVFTFHFISKFIKKRAVMIKHLNFNSTLIDGDTLSLLSEIEDLQLESLHLKQCDQLTNDGFISLIRVQTNLKELDLTFSVRITDKSIIEICENLKELRVLKLRRCRSITDNAVKMIAELKKLKYLDLSECEALTSSAVIDGIAKERNETLQELHLSAINICPKAISKITENIPNLRVLDLSYCINQVDDVCVQLILKDLCMLRELNLNCCERISDEGLTGMSMKEKLENFIVKEEIPEKSEELPIQVVNEPPRPSFRISLRTKAEEEIVNDALRKQSMMKMAQKINFDEKSTSNFSLSRLKGLRVLKLGNCNKISDVSLIYNFKLPELKEINLSRCQQISLEGIRALVENCPGIEIVNLSECHNINDKCIELIASKLPRLKFLDITRCYQLTDYSLDYIAMYCKRIRQINVVGCRNMSDEPQLRLLNAQTLKNISFSKSDLSMSTSPPIPPPSHLAMPMLHNPISLFRRF
jgi:F-box and leucine-rich repeat protein 9